MQSVFLDHNSTTALQPKVLEAMLPWLTQPIGNASSRHLFGRQAREAIEAARGQIAQTVGVQASQVIFTSGGTEANNWAIKGLTAPLSPSQLLISGLEHPCVMRPAMALAWQDWQVNSIATSPEGLLDIAHAKQLLAAPTGLVSAMLANNETGAIQPIAELALLARQHRALMHTDAVQALGKINLDMQSLGVHAMTLSSHKIGGPMGVGALVIDKRVDITPLLAGGGQERGLRSGSENVAAIVGFGVACALAVAALDNFQSQTFALRERFEQGLISLGAHIFAQGAARLSNTSFFAFDNLEGETLVNALDKAGYAVASGSACSSDSHAPSHVLISMGVAPDLARGAVRVSLHPSNTPAEIDGLLAALHTQVQRLKNLNAIAA